MCDFLSRVITGFVLASNELWSFNCFPTINSLLKIIIIFIIFDILFSQNEIFPKVKSTAVRRSRATLLLNLFLNSEMEHNHFCYSHFRLKLKILKSLKAIFDEGILW